ECVIDYQECVIDYQECVIDYLECVIDYQECVIDYTVSNAQASIFDRVLNQPHYEMKMKYFPTNLSSWEIKNGEGIPNLWNSRNSATWVIQWLEMEDSFMSTVIGELHDETVRMKTAMKLVMHDMNKMKKEVKTQSTLMWSKLPFI
ncbi:hypothetical protein Lal_00028121, partial [Lupinus albus]